MRNILTLIFLLAVLGAAAQDQSENVQPEFRNAAFQFTFMTPPLSTNGLQFYETVNEVSLNTYLGVSAGTERFEVGGFANIDLYYANGVQVAGFANLNGFRGHEYDYVSEGAQFAGFANVNGNRYKGAQVAGFANVNLKADEGIQIAGFANTNVEVHKTSQLAGFANVSLKGESGSQLSGFANVASDVKGVQLAGFANVARKVEGVQLSGFINICDSIDGIPISFISYVRQNGYRSFEIATSEWAPVQFNYKMGVKDFYNIYSLSKLATGWDRYALGFGIGHIIELAPKTELNLEAISHSAFSIILRNNYGNFQYRGYDQMFQLKPTIKQCLGNNICLNIGPTVNFNTNFFRYRSAFYFGRHDEVPLTNNLIQPYWKTMGDGEQKPSRIWIGFSAAVSFN